MPACYLIAIRSQDGRHEVVAERDDFQFPDFDRSKLNAPLRELTVAVDQSDRCVLVARTEIEPCIGPGLRAWFERDANEAQFFIVRYAQDWRAIYHLLSLPAAE
jgi:hypothetical protein